MQIEKIRANIYNAFMLAKQEEIEKGQLWYLEARRICRVIAKETGKPRIVVTGILSALSPATPWSKNIQDTRGFIKSDKYTCTTYKNQVRKAETILHMQKPTVKKICAVLNGQKTVRFFLNVYSAKYDVVTIDRHMISLIHGTFDHKFVPTPRRMSIIRNIFKDTAKELGLRPYQLQAAVWLVWKRINNI